MNQATSGKKCLGFPVYNKKKSIETIVFVLLLFEAHQKDLLKPLPLWNFLPTLMSMGANELAYFPCVFLSCTVIGLSWTVVLGNTLGTESLRNRFKINVR